MMLGAQWGRPAPGATLERPGASRSRVPCPQPASGSAHPRCGAARPAPACEPPRKGGTEREKTADRPPRGLRGQPPAAGGIPAGRKHPGWGLREGTRPPSPHEGLDGAPQPLGLVTMATAPLRHVPGLPRAPRPGSVAMAAGGLRGLVEALESYRGRDRAVRALCYGCQLAGGVLGGRQSPAAGLPGSLLAVSAQLSHCRTVLRLFDDLAMLSYSRGYGLGPEDEDVLVRGLSVLCNVADQLYYPCEHVAWAADAGIIRASSSKWWDASTRLWGFSLLLGVLRSLRILFRLRKKLRQQRCTSSPQDHKKMKAQVRSEVLSIVSNMADLANAIHWLPPGFLWAGQFPPWLVGLLGTVSSLIGIYQASREGNSGAV